MSRTKRGTLPQYRLHKASGQAIVTLRFSDGSRRDYLLGPFGSEESYREHVRLLAEWRANNQNPPSPVAGDTTVAELCWRFFQHVENYYRRPDGTPTSEVGEYKLSLRTLRGAKEGFYAHTLCRDFGPLQLKTVRQEMIDAGLARSVINKRIGRIKRAFRWGVECDLVPVVAKETGKSNYHALMAVSNLQPGRSKAKETPPILPVDLAIVDATLPRVTRPVAAMIQVQLLTGARPGEVCIMRGSDLDRSGAVWRYRPGRDQGPNGQHKNAHRGHSRVILIGPKAQEVLRPFLKEDGNAYLFSPVEARAEYEAKRRASRKTPKPPSKRARRRKRNPAWEPGDHYSVRSYAVAIRQACLLAGQWVRVVADENHVATTVDARTKAPSGTRRPPNVFDGRLIRVEGDRFAVADTKGHHEQEFLLAREAIITLDGQPCVLADLATAVTWWHPSQLRHARATEIRRRYGLEGAQVALGHAKMNVTQLYAERDEGLAEQIMLEMG
jgi:integrase